MTATHYSSSSSRGKLHVVSSSRRQIGRPSRMDMDLSAVAGEKMGWSASIRIEFFREITIPEIRMLTPK